MRFFLIILILIFSFQSLAKANDIKDFELEGFSLGDSLLNFFTKKQITTEMNSGYAHFYKDNKFVKLAIGTSNEYSMRTNLNIYDEISVTIKPDDKNFIIYGLSGDIMCKDNIKYCYTKQKEIVTDLKVFFNNNIILDEYEDSHWIDDTGKSIVNVIEILSKNEELLIAVSVYDMNEDLGYSDQISLEITSNEYENFLRNVANQ